VNILLSYLLSWMGLLAVRGIPHEKRGQSGRSSLSLPADPTNPPQVNSVQADCQGCLRMRFHLVCASIFSIQILYECRRGNLAGFRGSHPIDWLYSSLHAPPYSANTTSDSKTDSKRLESP
jgi:hypothetical protein